MDEPKSCRFGAQPINHLLYLALNFFKNYIKVIYLNLYNFLKFPPKNKIIKI